MYRPASSVKTGESSLLLKEDEVTECSVTPHVDLPLLVSAVIMQPLCSCTASVLFVTCIADSSSVAAHTDTRKVCNTLSLKKGSNTTFY